MWSPSIDEKQTEKCIQGQHQEVEAEKDRDAEPPAESYNPVDKLKKSLPIVKPQRAIPWERRDFLQRELKRWMDNEKF